MLYSMKKRVYFFVYVFVLLLFFGFTAFAEMEGEGTEENPYIITTEEDLFSIANGEVYDGFNLYYKLQNDIKIISESWIPISTFSGVFDGNNHTITGIKLIDCSYEKIGVFINNEGVIKNLSVDIYFEGNKIVAGLAAVNSGSITNCKVSGTIINTGSGRTGGVVALNNGGMVGCSSSNATIIANAGVTGGLVAYLNCGYVVNSYSACNITASGTTGGLVGNAYGAGPSNLATIKYCYASGIINSGIGAGLLGFASNSYVRVMASYFNNENKGNTNGFGADFASMKSKDLYYSWDFDNVWTIDEDTNDGYPYLIKITLDYPISVQGEIRDQSGKAFTVKNLDSTEKIYFIVEKKTEKIQNCCFFIAFYEEVDKLLYVNFYSENLKEISTEIEIPISKPTRAVKYIKIFLWDENLIPLCESSTIGE